MPFDLVQSERKAPGRTNLKLEGRTRKQVPEHTRKISIFLDKTTDLSPGAGGEGTKYDPELPAPPQSRLGNPTYLARSSDTKMTVQKSRTERMERKTRRHVFQPPCRSKDLIICSFSWKMLPCSLAECPLTKGSRTTSAFPLVPPPPVTTSSFPSLPFASGTVSIVAVCRHTHTLGHTSTNIHTHTHTHAHARTRTCPRACAHTLSCVIEQKICGNLLLVYLTCRE